jgi:4-diphosphocytidyl-2-C-methyl-D-erythritol kinase
VPSPVDRGGHHDHDQNDAAPDTLRISAYAKINLSLEIVGKRPDGFHELVSVTQTVSLADEVEVRSDSTFDVVMEPPLVDGAENLARRAAEALADATGRAPTGRLRIAKQIPLAAGLGGGSSDAAAALILLDRLWGTGLGVAGLGPIAAELGSDVPLFLHGGASLIRGRGEVVEPLPEAPPFWLVLACPSISPPDKTRALYRALRREEWSAGTTTLALAERLRAGGTVLDAPLVNSFDAAADRVYPDFPALRARLARLTDRPFRLTGAGPSLFTIVETPEAADEVERRLARTTITTFVGRSVSRRAAGRASNVSFGRSGSE